MFGKILKSIIYSLMGKKHNNYRRYSSSDYKKQHYGGHHKHYGQQHYKRKHKSGFFSSYSS